VNRENIDNEQLVLSLVNWAFGSAGKLAMRSPTVTAAATAGNSGARSGPVEGGGQALSFAAGSAISVAVRIDEYVDAAQGSGADATGAAKTVAYVGADATVELLRGPDRFFRLRLTVDPETNQLVASSLLPTVTGVLVTV
jgi:hypothetical protein